MSFADMAVIGYASRIESEELSGQSKRKAPPFWGFKNFQKNLLNPLYKSGLKWYSMDSQENSNNSYYRIHNKMK